MGLLTERGPPDWHPATDDIKSECKKAADFCQVDITCIIFCTLISEILQTFVLHCVNQALLPQSLSNHTSIDLPTLLSTSAANNSKTCILPY